MLIAKYMFIRILKRLFSQACMRFRIFFRKDWLNIYRSSHLEVFLGKCFLKICSKFTGEHPCRSAISIKLLCNFNEIALRRGCSLVNLLHIFRTPFLKNTSEGLLRYLVFKSSLFQSNIVTSGIVNPIQINYDQARN